MKKAELEELIRSLVKSSVGDEVAAAVAPLTAQQTEHMAKIKEAQAVAGLKSDPAQKGIGAARFVRAMAFAKGDVGKAVDFTKKAYNDVLGDAIAKSLAAGNLTAGGALVPPEFSAEIIELLRARTVVRRAGARVLPLDRGTLTIPRQTGASTASYVGESKDITKTEPTTGQLMLTAKKLAALVPISNDLLVYDAGNTADEFVRDDLVIQMSIREDLAFMRGDGLENTPKGIRNWVASANVLSQTGIWSTVANPEADLKRLLNALEGANVGMTNPAWFMAPQVKNLLGITRTTNGDKYFPEIMNGSLWGWPVYTTTAIPTNLTGTSTEVYLVDMADMVIGEASTIEIAVDSSASYIESGTLVSAFSRDETVMRAISRHDFVARHDESIALISDVTGF